MNQELDGNWMDLMTHSYASHVLRTLLVVLAGLPLDKQESNNKSKRSKTYSSNHSITPMVTFYFGWSIQKGCSFIK
jgi:hypothetical protein